MLERRDFLKLGGITALGVAGAGAMVGCTPQATSSAGTQSDAADAMSKNADTPSFLAPPETITDFAETKDYDIVVVGAGIAGTSAALTAAKMGAKVACLQKEATPSSQGNMGASLDLEKTSAAGRAALITYLIELSEHRANRALLEAWADHSYAALDQFEQAGNEGGIFVNEDEPDANRVLTINGYEVYLHANTYFGMGHDEVVKAITPVNEGLGVEYFFETPAVQLVAGNDGVIAGVIGQKTDGSHILFNANKGVILATGDYQSDPEMVRYYCPDMKDFTPLQMGRTGDGHKMGMWIGGEIEPIGHTKMVHDARVSRADAPFMMVNYEGNRFMGEGPLQGYLNNYVREYIHKTGDLMAGTLYTIVDSKWKTLAEQWRANDPENAVRDCDVYNNVRTCKVFYEGQTIEEACANAAADGYALDAAAVQASVDRYNELCSKGSDDDFGKAPQYLVAVDEPPYVVIPHDFGYGLSAIIGGLLTDENNQVLKADEHTPLGGLYAVGNVAGGFFGGSDYPMDVLGLSIGRAITSGYIAANHALAK